MKKKRLSGLILAMLVTLSATFVSCGEKKEDAENNSVKVEANKNNDNIEKQETIEEGNNSETVEKEKKEETPKKEESIKTKSVKMHTIDTGNSDAIFIEGEKNLLIDGGENGDENIVLSYLKGLGVKKIDYIIGTHPHADHIGGLDGIINEMEVEKLLVANGNSDTKSYTDFIKAASNKGVPPSVPLEGAKFDMGNGAYFKVYNTNGGEDSNEASLITMFVNGEDKVLLTGDAENEAEAEVLGKMEDVDILKVGHHGSKTSTSQSFLDKVNPEFAIITTGKDNKYGHPHKGTMDKLKNKNIEVHRTDECGNIVFTLTGNGVSTNCLKGSFDSPKGETKGESKKQNSESKKEEVNKSAETNGEEKVWLSATGSKYHTINNCGKMNPSKAIQKNLKDVIGKYEDCSKC